MSVEIVAVHAPHHLHAVWVEFVFVRILVTEPNVVQMGVEEVVEVAHKDTLAVVAHVFHLIVGVVIGLDLVAFALEEVVEYSANLMEMGLVIALINYTKNKIWI